MQQNLIIEKSTLVQVMVRCLTAPIHYRSQYRPRSISPYGVIRAQWVKPPLFRVLYMWYVYLPLSLQWRHNERDGVSNHQPHDCLLNRYSGADQQSFASLAFVMGIHQWPVNSPHKGLVTARKIFPFDDVITANLTMYKYGLTIRNVILSLSLSSAHLC